MYLVHLISIDLELSRLFNSPTLHCYTLSIPYRSTPVFIPTYTPTKGSRSYSH